MKRRKSHKPSRKSRENAAAFWMAWHADGVLLSLSPTYRQSRKKWEKQSISRVEWYGYIERHMAELDFAIDAEAIPCVKEISNKIQEDYGDNK